MSTRSRHYALKHMRSAGFDPFEHNRIVKQRKEYREMARAGRRLTLSIRRTSRSFALLANAAKQAAAQLGSLRTAMTQEAN